MADTKAIKLDGPTFNEDGHMHLGPTDLQRFMARQFSVLYHNAKLTLAEQQERILQLELKVMEQAVLLMQAQKTSREEACAKIGEEKRVLSRDHSQQRMAEERFRAQLGTAYGITDWSVITYDDETGLLKNADGPLLRPTPLEVVDVEAS